LCQADTNVVHARTKARIEGGQLIMDISLQLNTIWVLICTALVFFMQAGFCCLESGLCRSKNSINVAIKNIVDLCVASALFWLFGYGLMFGDSWSGWLEKLGFIDFAGSTVVHSVGAWSALAAVIVIGARTG
jgi:ammonia channel protein AmtB